MWSKRGTYHFERRECLSNIVADVLADGHVWNLVDKLDDALQRLLAASGVLERALAVECVQLKVGQSAVGIGGLHPWREVGNANKSTELGLETIENVIEFSFCEMVLRGDIRWQVQQDGAAPLREHEGIGGYRLT
jgi:hypothetical protein